MWLAIQALRRGRSLKLGDNFCQILSPATTFTLFLENSKVSICVGAHKTSLFKPIDLLEKLKENGYEVALQ